MSTVQVEDKVKKKLFSYAAKLQAESGRKVSLSEAIDRLLEMHSHQEDIVDKRKLLSLFGILQDRERSARVALRQLRKEEEKSIEEKYARASSRKSRS